MENLTTHVENIQDLGHHSIYLKYRLMSHIKEKLIHTFFNSQESGLYNLQYVKRQ